MCLGECAVVLFVLDVSSSDITTLLSAFHLDIGAVGCAHVLPTVAHEIEHLSGLSSLSSSEVCVVFPRIVDLCHEFHHPIVVVAFRGRLAALTYTPEEWYRFITSREHLCSKALWVLFQVRGGEA